MGKKLDLTGKKFGRWTVIKEVECGTHPREWSCRCECGTERIVLQNSLRSGVSKSCGCLVGDLIRKRTEEDLTNQRFGKLTVLKFVGIRKNGRVWDCICDCGEKLEVRVSALKCGSVKGCKNGCFRKLLFGVEAKNRMHYQYKASAKKRKLEWGLTDEYFFKLTKENCFYCGKEPANIYKSQANNGDYIYNGIDRLDNTKGYTKSNCVTACETCNKAKRKMGYKEFIAWIDKVSARFASFRPPKTRLVQETR